MHGSRCCLGCCTLTIAWDGPSKGPELSSRQRVMRPEVYWSTSDTSTREKNNSAVESPRSISPISTSNQTLDPHSNPEFVNPGFLQWNQERQQWIGNKRPQTQTQIREPKSSRNATFASLLETNKPFPQPVPLTEMIDFLVGTWENEGLYDFI